MKPASVEPLRLVTRGSALALTQSRAVASMLAPTLRHRTIDLQIINTRGDLRRDVPLMQLGEGVFVKALEVELLEGRADLAVHSLKDVPSAESPELVIAAVPEREDPRDALITRNGQTLSELPAGSVLATGSPRRVAQLRRLRPDLEFIGVRGNVDTRLRKLDDAEFDGLVMAVAGLKRLGLSDRVSTIFSIEECTPAVGQGALGVQCRTADTDLHTLLARIEASDARIATTAERAFLSAVGGGCRVPVGAFAFCIGDRVRLRAVVANLEGTTVDHVELEGSTTAPTELGHEMARALKSSMAKYFNDLERQQ